VVASGGGNVVASGGGNVVASGGGNVVASGGGNVVASGGGNVVASGGGNVVASGGGNVVASGGGNVVASGGGNVVASGGGNLIGSAAGNLIGSAAGNLIGSAGGNVVAAGGMNLIMRAFKSPSTAVLNLSELYQEGKALAGDRLGLTGPSGKAFTETEIADALASGKGPYRQKCVDASFDGSKQTCTTVVNPAGAQEVLISRKAMDFAKFIQDFQAASTAGDSAKAKELLATSTSSYAHAFIFSDNRWASPVGTWRLRLMQDGGNTSLPKGFLLLSDSEVTIDAPGTATDQDLASGLFKGAISAWLPNNSDGTERLDSFSMQFNWDKATQKLQGGQIAGDERNSAGAARVLRKALFEATMSFPTRIEGTWTSDDKSTNGRFEMIRGTATYNLK
jgi:hypothetical protein